ncbi:MAG: ATP-binding protein [Desulfobacteraceae bacterium]|nr:ATP-binding protein [Desulfobacteraceae bacterium]
MYIQRELKKMFHFCRSQFATVLITGPRQSGKSTFLQHELKGIPYITFDDPVNREFALADPNGFLDQFNGKPVILDEIQYVPEILQYIKIRIDQRKKPGTWIMTGSQQFHLMRNINETLAGRIAVIELCPFCFKEADADKKKIEDIVWIGLYPEPVCYPKKRDMWIKSYIQTYLERDVWQFGAIRDLRSFEMFISLCAAFHSQEFHPADLARDCGVSQPTIKSWVKILEASYFSILLPPFFKNYGKRVIKTPKFYFSDPSLVCHITRQPAAEAAIKGNMGGALFEGLIISEVWKAFYNTGKRPAAYFWRSRGGLEVDLIIPLQGKYWPIEIKLTSTPSAGHAKTLDRFKKLAGSDASDKGILVCRTDRRIELPGNNIAIPWYDFSVWLKKMISKPQDGASSQ